MQPTREFLLLGLEAPALRQISTHRTRRSLVKYIWTAFGWDEIELKVKMFGAHSKFLTYLQVILGLALFSGQFSPLEARTLAEIKSSGEIRICLAGSSKDFYQTNAEAFVEYLDNSVTTKRIIAKYVKLEKWNSQFLNSEGFLLKEESYTPELLKSGKCDLYPNDLTKLDWRANKIAYIDLFISRKAIVVHKSKKVDYSTIEDLRGKKVGVMDGTSYHSWVEELNSGALKSNPAQITFMSQKKALISVSMGEIDFAVTGADGAFWSINNFAPDAVVAFPVGLNRSVYGWCTRKEDKELQKLIFEFFELQRRDTNSAMNLNWKKVIGISLHDFGLYISANN